MKLGKTLCSKGGGMRRQEACRQAQAQTVGCPITTSMRMTHAKQTRPALLHVTEV